MLVPVLIRSVLLPAADWCCAAVDTACLALESALFRA